MILESAAELQTCQIVQNVISRGPDQAGLIESMWGQPVVIENCTFAGNAAEVELFNADPRESRNVFYSDSDLDTGEKDSSLKSSPISLMESPKTSLSSQDPRLAHIRQVCQIDAMSVANMAPECTSTMNELLTMCGHQLH